MGGVASPQQGSRPASGSGALPAADDDFHIERF